MAQSTLNVRMDETLKKDFDSICNELGFSMSTAVIILAKKMTREKRLPFDVSVDPFYSESNMNHLRRGIAALNAGEGKEHELVEDED